MKDLAAPPRPLRAGAARARRRHQPARRAGRRRGPGPRRPRGSRGGAHGPAHRPQDPPRRPSQTFDRLFAVFWDGERRGRAGRAAPPAREPPALPRGRALRWDPDARRMARRAGRDRPRASGPATAPRPCCGGKPFDAGHGRGRDLVAMERLLARLARRLATRRSRRLVPTRGRGRPDVRVELPPRARARPASSLSLARRDPRRRGAAPGRSCWTPAARWTPTAASC